MIWTEEAEPSTPELQRELRARLLAMKSGTPAQVEAAARLREHGDHALTRGEMPSKAAAALLLRCGCTLGEQPDLFESAPEVAAGAPYTPKRAGYKVLVAYLDGMDVAGARIEPDVDSGEDKAPWLKCPNCNREVIQAQRCTECSCGEACTCHQHCWCGDSRWVFYEGDKRVCTSCQMRLVVNINDSVAYLAYLDGMDVAGARVEPS